MEIVGQRDPFNISINVVVQSFISPLNFSPLVLEYRHSNCIADPHSKFRRYCTLVLQISSLINNICSQILIFNCRIGFSYFFAGDLKPFLFISMWVFVYFFFIVNHFIFDDVLFVTEFIFVLSYILTLC